MTTTMKKLLSLVVVGAALSACAGMVATYNRYMENQILSYGDWQLVVEATVTDAGIEGIVQADGCVEVEQDPEFAEATAQVPGVSGNPFGNPVIVEFEDDDKPEDSPTTTTSPGTTTQTFCRRFPVGDALVRVVVGDVEITRRTDLEGRFAVTEGSDLARLSGLGQNGIVEASYAGVEVQDDLRFGALDDVAALRLLDEMNNPDSEELTIFVTEWQGTEAAELALALHGDVVCGGFRDDWNEMMATGDINRINAVTDTYDRDWQALYCDTCAAECRALEGALDFSSEIGALGQ